MLRVAGSTVRGPMGFIPRRTRALTVSTRAQAQSPVFPSSMAAFNGTFRCISQSSAALATPCPHKAPKPKGAKYRPEDDPAVKAIAAHIKEAAGAAPRWLFLGPPGVGKGTYATRISKLCGLEYLSAGDLIRLEVASGSELGKEMKPIIETGSLLPDDLISRMMIQKISSLEGGVLIDGFPRRVGQAISLREAGLQPDMVLNLSIREDVLIEKCCGRRLCPKCGGNYNIANINFPEANGKPGVFMPPLDPPSECADGMVTRKDDTPEVVKHRLEIHFKECAPIEEYYRDAKCLSDFEITAGIPETLAPLLEHILQFLKTNQK